ncbi:hypothetical protein [Colwellia echini]|uniref:Uncharacterized protein n=1 Tax=Colwellia echini TaxID=1982103 RepID=A0ABY3N184_9GAMM|nr:hypothetical protein [Colwellia echini]TYK67121.1 hypothetical protein CWS31_000875 [Colwellia echini]
MYQYFLTLIIAFSLLNYSVSAVALENNIVSVSKIYIVDVEQDSQTTDLDVEHCFVNNINYHNALQNIFVLTGYDLADLKNTYTTGSIRAPPHTAS